MNHPSISRKRLRQVLPKGVVERLEELDEIDVRIGCLEAVHGSADPRLPDYTPDRTTRDHEQLYLAASTASLSLADRLWDAWNEARADAVRRDALRSALGADVVDYLLEMDKIDECATRATEAGYGAQDVAFLDVLEEINQRAAAVGSTDPTPLHLEYWTQILSWKEAVSDLVPCVRLRWTESS